MFMLINKLHWDILQRRGAVDKPAGNSIDAPKKRACQPRPYGGKDYQSISLMCINGASAKFDGPPTRVWWGLAPTPSSQQAPCHDAAPSICWMHQS